MAQHLVGKWHQAKQAAESPLAQLHAADNQNGLPPERNVQDGKSKDKFLVAHLA